jgi:hypothetical protein
MWQGTNSTVIGVLCSLALASGCSDGTTEGKEGHDQNTQGPSTALQIVSVACNPGQPERRLWEALVRIPPRKIEVQVRNSGSRVIKLWMSDRSGLKMSREERDEQLNAARARKQTKEEWQQMNKLERDELNAEIEELENMPYGVGIETGSPAKNQWYPARSPFNWVPAADNRPDRVNEVTIPAGQTCAFSILMPPPSQLDRFEAWRVFLINPGFKRIEEKVLRP